MKRDYLARTLTAAAASVLFVSPLYAEDNVQALTHVIAQQQKQLPIMLDMATRIDSISYADHNVLYKITMYGYEGKPGERVYYESYLTQQINKALCNQTAYLLLLELGNKITYRYSSTRSEPITEITLAPGDCTG